MLVGYQFTASLDDNKTPYDFMADPVTGLRPGMNAPPYGVSVVDLTWGTMDYKILPPLAVWRKGEWFENLEDPEHGEVDNYIHNKRWQSYVVSGEGTPGNFKWRVYVCAEDVAAEPHPRHPKMWPKQPSKTSSFGDSKSGSGYSSSYSSGYGSGGLPTSLRIRCPGCGHWFRVDDLAPHTKNACPGVHGDDHDWMIACECGGSCPSLDQTAKIKPGFPRKPSVPAQTPQPAEPAGQPAQQEGATQ